MEQEGGSDEADEAASSARPSLGAVESDCFAEERDEAASVEQYGECCGVDEDGEVRGPGEAIDAEAVMQLPVDGDGDDGDDGSCEHGEEGFACGVEGAGVDGLRGPECERDCEDGEVARLWRRRRQR